MAVVSQRLSFPPLKDRPLVTFALFAYNQEKYILEAVEGALAQTYRPLEIILSDDSSHDDTFRIMSELARKYKGPHSVRLNRNKMNLGISDHVRRVHEIAQGEFIVHAAGDDISLPQRTSVLVNAFTSEMPSPSIVTSNFQPIDENGIPFEIDGVKHSVILRENHHNPLKVSSPINGCAVAIHREIIDKFPSQILGIIAEDVLLQRRAMLLNGKKFIPDLLVQYRVTSGGASNFRTTSRDDYLAYLNKWTLDEEKRLEQLCFDMREIGFEDHLVKKELFAARRRVCLKKIALNGPFLKSVYAFLNLFFNNSMRSKVLLFQFALRWLPAFTRYSK